jgi:ribosomal protein S12 methylthiotransferase
VKVAYINLGCPKNQVDLEIVLGGLDGTVQLCETAEEADAVIINSCAFIESAKRESIDAVFDAVSVKAQNPKLKVLVMGCLPQRYKDELAVLIPEVDRYFYSTRSETTLREVKKFLHEPNSQNCGRKLLSPSHYAYLRIADGCDNRCAYCAIPLIKGRFTSRPPGEIVREATDLARNGVKELMVIAQDTTSYGRDLPDNGSLSALLKELHTIDDLQWIRLLYTHPAHWSEALMDDLASLDKVVPYADIPIQHIADPILSSMGRNVTRAQIERLIASLRIRVPDVAIRTSIIVGYPGETDADFNELLDFLQEARFERLGVFTYSHEDGTRAYQLTDDVPDDVKLERQREIMRVQAEIVEERNNALIGRTLRVLVDELDKENNVALGRSVWDAPEVDGNIMLPPDVVPGEFYNVRIVQSELFDLVGEVI